MQVWAGCMFETVIFVKVELVTKLHCYTRNHLRFIWLNQFENNSANRPGGTGLEAGGRLPRQQGWP